MGIKWRECRSTPKIGHISCIDIIFIPAIAKDAVKMHHGGIGDNHELKMGSSKELIAGKDKKLSE